ncbi:MAG: phosphatidate cytidylyltransferase [Aggregatilineales bacterium]
MTSLTREKSETDERPPRGGLPVNIIRILTGFIFMPVTLYLITVGGWQLMIALLVIMCIALLEFLHMFHAFQNILQTPLRSIRLLFIGVIYVCVPVILMIGLRNNPPDGLLYFISAVLVTWGTDTFAYLVGRAFGRRLLVPHLSPGKTVEGALGGVIGGFLSGLIPFAIVQQTITPWIIILLVMSPVAAILGDLLESKMKRLSGVKDSGVPGLNPFPGHGGVLDRIDSLLAVMTLFSIGYMLLH